MGKMTVFKTAAGELRLSARGVKLAELLAEGVSHKLAAQLSGLSPRHISRQVSRPEFEALLDHMTRRRTRSLAPWALNNVVGLATQKDSLKVNLDANLRLLDINGLRAANAPPPSINVNVQAGIMLTKQSTPEQIAAAKEATGSGYILDWDHRLDEPKSIELKAEPVGG